MVKMRLYRLAFAPMLVAVVAIMFSLEGAPAALEPATPPATFDGKRAANQARQIVALAPERPPGSSGDEAVADLVLDRFSEIAAGSVTEQEFEAGYEGVDVSLRNVLLTLPGDPASTIVVLAGRDSAHGPGAASSAAATGILLELANALGLAGHEKTFVLASTSGTAAGAAGSRELVEGLPERDSVEAVIVISQPGAAEPRPPYVVTSSSGRSSGPVRLARTAELAVATQAQARGERPSPFTQLARLAIPSGLGDQAPLIADRLDAVAISSAGERPLAEADDTPRAALDREHRRLRARDPVDRRRDRHRRARGPASEPAPRALRQPGPRLDARPAGADPDPAGRGRRRGRLRARRARWQRTLRRAWPGALARGLPFLGALLALYGLALVGALPRPPFPFDPGRYELGGRAALVLSLILAAGIATAVLLRRRGVTASAAPEATIVGLGLVSALACSLLWLANPYLALLAAPLAHRLAARSPAAGSAAAVAAIALGALACLPVIAALVAVASALELGRGRAVDADDHGGRRTGHNC